MSLETNDLARPDTCYNLLDSVSGCPTLRRDRIAIHNQFWGRYACGPKGSLSFNDSAAGVAIARANIRTLTFNGNSADLGGTTRLEDGSRVIFSVSVAVNSPDGSSDSFTISLSNGYSAGGTLTNGDIRTQ